MRKPYGMRPERRDRLWSRLYNLDAYGLSDFLNGFTPDKAAKWTVGKYNGWDVLYLNINDSSVFMFDRFDLWRENVSYYMGGMCDVAARYRDEKFCDIFVYKLWTVMFPQFNEEDSVVKLVGPKEAKEFLFW